jgi:hypothetical protein
MRKMLGILALISISACATQTPPLAPQSIGFDDGARTMRATNPAHAAIEYYATLAAAKNADGMVYGYDSAVREAMDDIHLRDFLAQSTVPFFADYQAMDREDTVTPVSFPAGRRGEIHYTYIVTRSNTVKPVIFALVNDDGQIRIASVTLNNCIAGKRPNSNGRCN